MDETKESFRRIIIKPTLHFTGTLADFEGFFDRIRKLDVGYYLAVAYWIHVTDDVSKQPGFIFKHKESSDAEITTEYGATCKDIPKIDRRKWFYDEMSKPKLDKNGDADEKEVDTETVDTGIEGVSRKCKVESTEDGSIEDNDKSSAKKHKPDGDPMMPRHTSDQDPIKP